MEDVRGLADAVLKAAQTDGDAGVRFRQGTIVSVQTTTYTVKVGAATANVAGVKSLAGPHLANDVVWLVQQGPTLMIVNSLSRADPGWIAPTFTNAWANYGGGWSTAGYRKDASGFVHLRGLIGSGTVAAAAFTLPAGYRPLPTQSLFSTISNGAVGRVNVYATGVVMPDSPCSNAWVALDGITFLAEG